MGTLITDWVERFRPEHDAAEMEVRSLDSKLCAVGCVSRLEV